MQHSANVLQQIILIGLNGLQDSNFNIYLPDALSRDSKLNSFRFVLFIFYWIRLKNQMTRSPFHAAVYDRTNL